MEGWTPWIVGGVLIALFLLFAAVNASVLYIGVVKKEKTGSGVPFIGGLFGMVGVATLPVPWLRDLWWLPLLLDIGCVPYLLYFAFWWVFLRKGEEETEDDETTDEGGE